MDQRQRVTALTTWMTCRSDMVYPRAHHYGREWRLPEQELAPGLEEIQESNDFESCWWEDESYLGEDNIRREHVDWEKWSEREWEESQLDMWDFPPELDYGPEDVKCPVCGVWGLIIWQDECEAETFIMLCTSVKCDGYILVKKGQVE